MNTGRPPHEPTPALRRLVEHHAATGTLHRQIAKLLGLSLNTLKKHYREELDLGLARANAVVSGTLFTEAKRGNITACIFWMKTRGNWRESMRVESTGADGGPIETKSRLDLSDLSPEERDALRQIVARRAGEAEGSA
jgi:hypothetical protein